MRQSFRSLLCTLAAFSWPVAAAFGQSSDPSSQQAPQNQPQGPSQAQPQTPPQQKEDSVVEAARKAKAKKAASAQGKVFNEDDLSGMKKEGVSVVGTESKKRSQPASSSKEQDDDTLTGEKYWRGRAQPLLQKIVDIDRQIAQIQEDIKKYGIGGVDITTGFKDSVAYVEDRNGQIQKLQKKKADLQKQLDDLEEEGRKAGAEPAWFR